VLVIADLVQLDADLRPVQVWIAGRAVLGE